MKPQWVRASQEDYERAGNSCGKTRTIHAMLFPHMPPLEHVGKKVGE